jgi:hypothetical protein
LRAPASRSPSRWPGTVRSAMLAGRSAIKSGSTVCPRVGPFVVPRLLRRMRRCAVSSRLSTPRAWTHRLHTFRLVRQLHRRILGIGAHEPARDLCRRPLACEFRPDQAGHHRQLASLRPARPRRRVRAAASASTARYAPRPPVYVISRLTVNGARPSVRAVVRTAPRTASPREMDSRSSVVRAPAAGCNRGRAMPPAPVTTPVERARVFLERQARLRPAECPHRLGARETVTCPQGKTSVAWRTARDDTGSPRIHARFSRADCGASATIAEPHWSSARRGAAWSVRVVRSSLSTCSRGGTRSTASSPACASSSG